MRESPTTTHPGTGSAPPERPVPAPRATIGRFAPRAIETTRATSSVEAGRTTRRGATRTPVSPSHS